MMSKVLMSHRSIAGTTESNYLAYTKSQHLTPQSVNLPGLDTKAFWIGSPDAESVVIFYHGGGFAMPAGDGHIAFVSSLVSNASKSGKSVAVLMLQYDLAPAGQYPRQLLQAVELLRYATAELGRSPEHMMLMGDSAGANLILGVLSHLMHPHPSIKALKLSKPLKTAVICSPVTVLDNAKNERFRTHEAQDPASADAIRVWLSNFLGSSRADAWNEPMSNDASWWNGLAGVVEDMLITVASNEMMADDTRALAGRIKVGVPMFVDAHRETDHVQTVYESVTLFASENDFHAEPTIGPALGMKEGEAAQLMISWALERS